MDRMPVLARVEVSRTNPTRTTEVMMVVVVVGHGVIVTATNLRGMRANGVEVHRHHLFTPLCILLQKKVKKRRTHLLVWRQGRWRNDCVLSPLGDVDCTGPDSFGVRIVTPS